MRISKNILDPKWRTETVKTEQCLRQVNREQLGHLCLNLHFNIKASELSLHRNV